MVQRKVPNKLGIKPHHLKLDTKLPSTPQTHEKLNKIMKKSRPIKRPDESRSLPPFKKKKTQPLHNDEPRSTPNYMKSTSCFEARKEQSPKTPTTKVSKNSKTNGSKTSSLKKVKTTSFKPLRVSKKVVLCEDLDANRATCSSTLKESKFPNYLQLNHGGTELQGTSAMKVCPYTYCSLNGHHHAPLPPLKCFLSARRRAMKTQKSFKLGCLSPRQKTPVLTKNDIREPVILAQVDMKTEHEEEKNRDFFVEIDGCRDLECSDIDWEEGYCSASSNDDVGEEKTGGESLYGELQELYDEESVSSGAWSEDSESDSWYSYQQMKINQDFINSDVSSTDIEAKVNDKMDEFQDQNIKCSIEYQQEKTFQESKTVPDFDFDFDFAEDGNEKNGTTIIYNIIQFNISIFINGEKTETDKGVTRVAEDKNEVNEVQEMSDAFDQDVVSKSNEQLDVEKQDDDAVEENVVNATVEEDEEQTHFMGETDIKTYNEEQSDPCKNPRGPNFLPEVVGPDAETVDLRHQNMDERKNAEEWMVDFALRQAVNTIAPAAAARKKKVALLVEAFEKVMPQVPKYETHNRRTSKAFTNARPMQACS